MASKASRVEMHWKAGVLGMNQKPDTGIPCQGGGGDHHFTHHHHHHHHHCHRHHQHQCYDHHRHRHHELLNHRICTECLSCFLLHNSCQSNMEMVFIGGGLFIGMPFVDLSVWFVTYLQWLTLIWPNSKQSCVCETTMLKRRGCNDDWAAFAMNSICRCVKVVLKGSAWLEAAWLL